MWFGPGNYDSKVYILKKKKKTKLAILRIVIFSYIIIDVLIFYHIST